MIDPLQRNVGIAFGTLLASTATLVCCVLPAVLVSLGAGAVLVGLVSSFPQLVWLSEHKIGVFAVAGALLAVSGVMIWRARSLPCPVEPAAARACTAAAPDQCGFIWNITGFLRRRRAFRLLFVIRYMTL